MLRIRRRYRTIARVATALVVLSLAIQGGPVPVRAATTPFVDIADSPFRAEIEWLYGEGITRGCTPDRFCPNDQLTRGQMAAFLVRMFDLPYTTTDAFTDDETSIYEGEINSLAASGITMGCTPTTYCPRAMVRRDEMASFLARAIPLNVGDGRDYFRDDNGTTHELDIDRVAAAGITAGCDTWIYCPDELITRGEMAAFLRRVLFPLETPLAYPAPGPVTLHVAVTGNDATNDCLDPGSPCRTIRRAISLALVGDTVAIGPGTFNEENLQVGRDLTITGDPGGGTTIDAGGGAWARILTIYPDTAVTLDHLTFTGGSQEDGGAIYSRGTLTIADSTFVDNGATDGGGAIFSRGALTVTGSMFSENHARLGGAIWRDHLTGDDPAPLIVSDTELMDNAATYGGAIWSFGPFELTNSLVHDNSAVLFGGGVYAAQGTQTISTSTFTGNTARFGGGLLISGSTTVKRSTFNDNTAADAGGAIQTSCGVMDLVNSTIAGNVAPVASGVYINCGDLTMRNTTVTANIATYYEDGGAVLHTSEGSAPMRLFNSIIAGNTGGDVKFDPDVVPVKTATIVGVPAGLTIADILDALGLGNHGGPTQTIALVDDPSNPAIGAGSATVCAAAPVGGIDQRGLPRTGACDLGAYELQP